MSFGRGLWRDNLDANSHLDCRCPVGEGYGRRGAAMMQSASVVLLFQDKPVAGEGRIQRNFIAASDVWRDNLPLFLAWFGAGR